MNPAAAFFFVVLALQAVFTVAVVWLVGRRFPARLRAYRFIAPAALPLLMFALVLFASLQGLRADPQRVAQGAEIPRIFLAYTVLWLIGVLIASFVIRRLRK